MKMTEKRNYGLTLSGKIRVFRKDKDIEDKQKGITFTVTDVWFNVSEREQNGEWFNISINLLFPRKIEPPQNNSVIEIIEAFPTITGKGKYRKVAYFVKGWHYANEKYSKPTKGIGSGPNGEITDDDLPF